MKCVNHIVIGTFIFTLLMAFGSPSFGALPISEEFDGPTYAFNFENYQPGVAEYTASQDTNSVLSGVNSAKLAISSPGSEWWAIQVRTNHYVYATSIVSISFDIKSSALLNCIFRIEGPNDPEDFPISLAPGETKHYEFLTTEFENGGPTWFIFALGNSLSEVADVWLDNVQIEVVSSSFLDMPVEEEFDSAPEGKFFGHYSFENYGAGAAYVFDQDTGSVLSGANSAHLDIFNSGTEWWAIQVRLENLVIEANTIVDVSFDIKSTEDISFISRIEGAGNEVEDEIITVLAGETKAVKYQTGMLTNANFSTFLMAMGASISAPTEVWVDNITLRKWAPISDIGPIILDQLPGTEGLVLTWNTTEGYDYALETKPSLPSTNWETNMIVPGVDGSVTVTTAVDQVKSFYRVTSE